MIEYLLLQIFNFKIYMYMVVVTLVTICCGNISQKGEPTCDCNLQKIPQFLAAFIVRKCLLLLSQTLFNCHNSVHTTIKS